MWTLAAQSIQFTQVSWQSYNYLILLFTLLSPGKTRTHCGGNKMSSYVARPWAKRGNIVAHRADTKNGSEDFQKHFCVHHKCCARGKTSNIWETWSRQQCCRHCVLFCRAPLTFFSKTFCNNFAMTPWLAFSGIFTNNSSLIRALILATKSRQAKTSKPEEFFFLAGFQPHGKKWRVMYPYLSREFFLVAGGISWVGGMPHGGRK